jgi:putative peptide zinc metalloprotease protein
MIDGKRNVDELTHALNVDPAAFVSIQQVDQVIKETLEPYGIVKSKKALPASDRVHYLRLRMTLLPGSIVSSIGRVLHVLIPAKPWPFILFLLAAITGIYLREISFTALTGFITPERILGYFVFSIFSRLVHEFGHASACEKFGIKAGNIGFGFYLFMPVFYADVSDAWMLTPRKRIIINAAGMYFQLLLSCVMVTIFFITGNQWLLYASLINILGFLPNINPFVRYDGYWIITDWLGINNLMAKSREKFQATVEWFAVKFKGCHPLQTRVDIFLFGYFIISRVMMAVFILVACWTDYLPDRVKILNPIEVQAFLFFRGHLISIGEGTSTFKSSRCHLGYYSTKDYNL